MKNDKIVMKSESVCSDDGLHRILLRKEWDRNKPSATIIMIAPSIAKSIEMDLTTMLVVNNVYQLGFGSVNIVNLYSRISSKLLFKGLKEEELVMAGNDNCIKTSVEKSDCTIIAWGSIGDNHKRVAARQKSIFKLLETYMDKVKIIGDEKGRIGLHPLTPSVRKKWVLKNCKELKLK